MNKNHDAKGRFANSHGMHGTPTWRSWASIIQRCTMTKDASYVRYGGRGVEVCERWKVFENFYADMGERPDGCTVDRIDNARGYEPGNCRWATASEQAKNRRSTRFYELDGERLCIKDWSRRFGIPYLVLFKRIGRGWPLRDALTLPVDSRHKPFARKRSARSPQ